MQVFIYGKITVQVSGVHKAVTTASGIGLSICTKNLPPACLGY
jgi:hypothetical protein